MLLSPFIYLAVYLGFVALAKFVTRSRLSLHQLALAFAFSLLPIVLVYNITHYYTLMFTQGVKIISLLSDRSEEHTTELQSLMRISYAVLCLKKNKTQYH